MGRPPKKRVRSDEEELNFSTQNKDIWHNPEDTTSSFSMAPDPATATDAQHLCPQLYWPPSGQTSYQEPLPDLLGEDGDHNHIWRPERLRNPNLPVPPSSSPWPDFSTVSAATASLFPVPPDLPEMHTLPLTPPMSTCSDPTASCTCLSYLYLCLSHISSIASFPVNSHTLCSLYIAARTAQNVIRCQVCPKSFATGIQNVMLTGTLLTVAADAWLRVSNSDAAELGVQSAPPEYASRVLQSADPAQAWDDWLRQIVRRAVIGGQLDPEAGTRCSDQPDLLSLINEVENRQRRWHAPGQHPLSPGNVGINPNESDQPCNENELLCFRVVGNARSVISRFNFEPYEFPPDIRFDDVQQSSSEQVES